MKSGKRRIQKNQPELVCLVLLLMVRKERLELSRLGRQNLNLVRLPISPLPQIDGGYDGIRTCDPRIMSAML